MKKKILCFMFFYISCFIHAQTGHLTITGRIVNIKGNPIVNANIVDNTGNFGCISDSSGFFYLKVYTKIKTLFISHIGYETTTININDNIYKKDSCSFLIKLKPKITKLNEVEINGNNTEIAYKNKNIWVIDYELTKQGIFILTSKNIYNNKNLILLNYSGDTIAFKVINKKINKIYKDIFSNILLLSPDSVYQAFLYEKDIRLIYPKSIEKINNEFLSIIGSTQQFFIQRKYSDFNQTINYFYIDKKTRTKHFLIRISNDKKAQANKNYVFDKLKSKTNLSKTISDFNNTDELEQVRKNIDDDLFFKLILSKPIYDPLKIIDNEILVFDFEDDKLLFYNKELKLKRKLFIDFHKSKYWDNKVLIDPPLKNCYTKFIHSGIVTLKEIDLSTGKVIKEIKLEHPFPQKIRINNNIVYYMYYDISKEMNNKRYLFKYTIKD